MEKPPQYVAPPPDPQAEALKAQTQKDQIAAIQDTVKIDTASLMARYGTRLAMAQSNGASAGTVTPSTAPLLGFQAGTGGPVGTPPVLNAVFGKSA